MRFELILICITDTDNEMANNSKKGKQKNHQLKEIEKEREQCEENDLDEGKQIDL